VSRDDPPVPLTLVDAGRVPYGTALRWQNDLHRRRVAGEIGDVLLALEHPHVYTLGRRFAAEHLLADRGGSITYHGPGQLVGYPILALADPAGAEPGWGPDAVAYLRLLEQALIQAAGELGVTAERREGLTGVWVQGEKLASIGVNVSRGVTKHGFALNVTTDLAYFAGMVPCGIDAVQVTSLARLLGEAPPMAQVQEVVVTHLAGLLGAVVVPGSRDRLGLRDTLTDRMPGQGSWGSTQAPAMVGADGRRAGKFHGQS
jgi:lipoyl(octanoyl) transferase